MMQLKKSLMTAGVLVTCFVLGCGRNQEKKEEVKNKNEITVGVTSFADTLEPTEQYFSWVVSRYGIGETLTKFDQKGRVIPSLAESWINGEDGRTWIFKIRKGVKFSDGTEMTPEIVKESIERTFKLSNRAKTFFNLQELVVDGQNLIIKTDKPIAGLPGCLADPLFLVVNTQGDTDLYASKGPICTGPYMVESFDPTEQCVVIKNNYYWGGEVPLDKISFKCIDDQITRSMALQSGEIQIAYNLKTENLLDFQDITKYNIQSLDSLRTTFAFMNENGILKDKVLRQAILRALDKETYAKTLLEGGAKSGKAPVPPTLDFGFEELIDENTYNPESAKKLLAENGYKDIDNDGYLETPNGEKIELEFVIYSSREELKVYAQASQISLKEIGINIKINTVSYETLLDLRDAGKFDLLIWNVLVANTGDPEKYLRENWYSKSPSNQTGYKNKKVDELLDKLSVEYNKDLRRNLIIEIQQLIMNDAPTIFFGYETTYLITSKDIENALLYPTDYYWVTDKISIRKESKE